MGAVTLGGKFNPGSAVIGDNLVNYSITSGPCRAYAQITVSVEEFISAAFSKSIAPICFVPGKTPAINLNSYAVNPGPSWEVNGTLLGASNSMFDPNNTNFLVTNPILFSGTKTIPRS